MSTGTAQKITAVGKFDLLRNRQPFCVLCPDEHERKCRCQHHHFQHNFAGGCIQCFADFLIGARSLSDVCDRYDQRPKKVV